MCSSILVQSLATPRELDLVEERTCPLESVTSTLKVSESSCKTVSKAFLRLIVSGITKTTPLGSVDVKSNCGIQIYHWLVRMVVAFIWTNFCMCMCFVSSGLMSCSPHGVTNSPSQIFSKRLQNSAHQKFVKQCREQQLKSFIAKILNLPLNVVCAFWVLPMLVDFGDWDPT